MENMTEYHRKWAEEHKAERRKYRQEWYEKNRKPGVKKRIKLEAKIDGLSNRQKKIGVDRPKPETCDCCGFPPSPKGFHADHDHETGKFRGWLCHKCNVGIGMLGDCSQGVSKALKYLTK